MHQPAKTSRRASGDSGPRPLPSEAWGELEERYPGRWLFLVRNATRGYEALLSIPVTDAGRDRGLDLFHRSITDVQS